MQRLSITLLRLYPPAFRERFGGEMLQCLRDAERDGRPLSRLTLITDLVGSAARQRIIGGTMRSKLPVIGFIVIIGLGGTVLVTGGGILSAAPLVGIGITGAVVLFTYGVAAITTRLAPRGAEHAYGTKRRWWWVGAAAVALFQVALGVGQLIDDPKIENVAATLIFAAFGAAIAYGMRLHNRRAGNWLICFGVLPSLSFFWMIAPTIVAMVVIVNALADNIRMTAPRPA